MKERAEKIGTRCWTVLPLVLSACAAPSGPSDESVAEQRSELRTESAAESTHVDARLEQVGVQAEAAPAALHGAYNDSQSSAEPASDARPQTMPASESRTFCAISNASSPIFKRGLF